MIRVYLGTEVVDKFVRYAAGKNVPAEEQDSFQLLKRLVFSQNEIFLPKNAINSPLVCAYFAGQSRVALKPDDDLLERVQNDPTAVLEQPSGIFILDLDDVRTQQIQKDYGVVCQGFTGSNLAVVSEYIPDLYWDSECKKTWKKILNGHKNIPSNACIIYDKYFFKKGEGGTTTLATSTLSSILCGLLPQTSKTEYHILIWYEHQAEQTPCGEIAQLVEETLQPIRSKYEYPIMVEVLSQEVRPPEASKDYTWACNNLHDRCILCNYLFVNPTANIKLFRAAQTIYFEPAFSNMNHLDLDHYPCKKINAILNYMRRFLEVCEKEKDRLSDNYLALYRNGKRIEDLKVENRLLK